MTPYITRGSYAPTYSVLQVGQLVLLLCAETADTFWCADATLSNLACLVSPLLPSKHGMKYVIFNSEICVNLAVILACRYLI